MDSTNHTRSPQFVLEDSESTIITKRETALDMLKRAITRFFYQSKTATPPDACYSCAEYSERQMYDGIREAMAKERNKIYLEKFYTGICILEPQKSRNRKSSISYLGKHVLI